jgi:undecaprenyl-diphosphatase
MRRRILELDQRIFSRVAAARLRGAHPVLPRLSRAADHSKLWMATAAVLGATGQRTGRRAALRGVASLAIASAVTNTLAKPSARRARPVIDAVPVVRRLTRQPITTSFPSGHSASAAAFAVGVALESPYRGLLVAPVPIAAPATTSPGKCTPT